MLKIFDALFHLETFPQKVTHIKQDICDYPCEKGIYGLALSKMWLIFQEKKTENHGTLEKSTCFFSFKL